MKPWIYCAMVVSHSFVACLAYYIGWNSRRQCDDEQDDGREDDAVTFDGEVTATSEDTNK